MSEQQPPTFDKHLYDACMKQADYFAGRWDSRKGFEWKSSISLWTLLALGSGFLAGKGNVHCLAIPITVLVPPLLHYWWLDGIWRANDFDKEMGRRFRDMAQTILAGGNFAQPSKPEPRPRYEFFEDWSMRFQLSCTTLLVIVLVVLNHMPMPPQTPPH
jgi:hypothetical protein